MGECDLSSWGFWLCLIKKTHHFDIHVLTDHTSCYVCVFLIWFANFWYFIDNDKEQILLYLSISFPIKKTGS